MYITSQKITARKSQIYETATKLFKEKGYVAASMRDLAAELGIEAASLYAHVKSKEEILQNIIFLKAEDFFNALKKAEAENQDSDASTKLFKIILSHLLVIMEDLHSSAVFFNEWRHLSAPWLQEFLRLRDEYEGNIRKVIEEGIDKGEFRNVDSKISVLTILSSLNWIHTWYNPEGKRSAEEIAREIGKLFIKGMERR